MVQEDDCRLKISEFETKHPEYKISYGGDGTLLRTIQEFGPLGKTIVPVRDYGRCKVHADMLERLLGDWDPTLGRLATTRHKYLSVHMTMRDFPASDYVGSAVAEVSIRSTDPTEALRFDVLVNGRTYLENCIADGIVYASEMGSHGYWKSVTRTIFRGDDNVGLGFVAPTYGINHLVLKGTDFVEILMKRSAAVDVAWDKTVKRCDAFDGDRFSLCQDATSATLMGYDEFCCYMCRRNRNSTVLNDMYFA